ncbi:MAG: prepilin peptidase [Clostridiales bacterium]|nr:prepilin peptidase [Clostridiales bacterium]
MFYIFAAVVVFAGIYVLGFNAIGITTCIFLLLLVACAAADLNKGIIPDLIVIFIAVLAVINFFINETFSINGLIDHLIGAVCVSVPMLIVSLLIKNAFGGGDIKLMAATGLYLGWRNAVAGLVIGLFIAGVYSLILIIFKKAGFKSKIRIAPCLAFGLGAAALFGNLIVRLLFGW